MNDPQLTFTGTYVDTDAYVAPVTVSYLGTGTISINQNYIYEYELIYTNNTLTLQKRASDPVDRTYSVSATISLSASPGYNAVSKQIRVYLYEQTDTSAPATKDETTPT